MKKQISIALTAGLLMAGERGKGMDMEGSPVLDRRQRVLLLKCRFDDIEPDLQRSATGHDLSGMRIPTGREARAR